MPAETVRPQDGDISLALTHEAKCIQFEPEKASPYLFIFV
jgi:hypothetical protein